MVMTMMTLGNSSLGISNTIGMAFISLPLFESGGMGQGQFVFLTKADEKVELRMLK